MSGENREHEMGMGRGYGWVSHSLKHPGQERGQEVEGA